MFHCISISSFHKVYYASVDYGREEELRSILSSKNIDISELKQISNQKRKIEWMSIREIISEVMPENEDIVYNKERKPFFKNSKHQLSISHSNEMIAISIHEKITTGIDIQYITDKIVRIKDKFLSKTELVSTVSQAIPLTCYWSAKEALFKIYGKKDAYLKENILITEMNFDGSNGTAYGIVKAGSYKSEHHLSLQKLGNYILAYSTNP